MDPAPTAGQERILLLECRLEQRRSQLESARAEADVARTRLADAAAREADHARRYGAAVQELAEARAEVASLQRRLEHSEALRAELEGEFFEPGAREDAEELVRLRREVLVERHRANVSARAAEALRERVEELRTSRETILSYLAEWQVLVRRDGPEAVDLARYMAELRREILDLESRNTLAERRETAYRQRLASAGIAPDEEMAKPLARAADSPAEVGAEDDVEGFVEDEDEAEPTVEPVRHLDGLALDELPLDELPLEQLAARAPDADLEPAAELEPSPEPSAPPGATRALVAALDGADVAAMRAELRRCLETCGEEVVLDAIRPWTESDRAAVRAAAYEALGLLLGRNASALEPFMHAGLGDADGRVRRRVVLAVAAAHGLPLRSLLEPVRVDRDPQVRRMVLEILRHTPPVGGGERRPGVEAGVLSAAGPVA